MNALFKLRGDLTGQQSIVLSIIGFLLLILLWSGLAYALSTDNIREIDYEGELQLADETYYMNDSLQSEHLDSLMLMSDEELEQYGLQKRRVYASLPSPISVFKVFGELEREDNLSENSFKSIRLNFGGYVVAILLAIPIGFLLGLIPLFKGLFQKIIDSFRFIPLTAVTGIFVLWLGFDSTMKITFLAFGILVYLIPVVIQRINEVDDVYLKTTFTLGATDWQTIKTVYLPAVLSKLFDDIRVLTAISWTYITIAEMLNKSGGIGELIWVARRQSRIDKAFAVLIVIVVIGILQDLLFKWLDKVLFPHKYA